LFSLFPRETEQLPPKRERQYCCYNTTYRQYQARVSSRVLAGLSRAAGRTVSWIAGFSQIADGIVNPSLQRAEDIGDVLGPDGCRVHAADAGVCDVDVAAAPHRSRL